MDPAVVKAGSVKDDHAKYQRFERIAEIFTYSAVVGGVLLTLLPYQFPFDKLALYKLMGFVAVFSFAWFRLLPKKFIGLRKTLIYYLASIIFIAVAVHFTNGIQSFVIFLFYLTVLSAAAGLELYFFILMVALTMGYLMLEALLLGEYQASFAERFNLMTLHLWGLLMIAFYGRYTFDEQSRVKSADQSVILQNAKKIDSVKNEFVFVISNKLKEPILTLQNFLETAKKGKNSSWSPDLEELLDKTIENSQRLSSLVNDLSDLSRIESQKLRLEIRPIVVSQIIGSTLSDFNMRASEKKITVAYEPGKEELTVLGDPSRLHEILANLVDNAIKYSASGGNIKVGFEKVTGFGQIWVKDIGYGIPEEAKEHMFEKFYRVSRSSSEPKGTGLGLFVTKELVERQKGKIWYESEVGKGTTFFFTLPLADGK